MEFHAAATESPSWTDKLEAWSTLGAAVFAALTVIVAFLVWRHDQKLRREDKLDAQSALAWRVLATMEALGDPDQGWIGLRYGIRNNSPDAITDVGVRLRFLFDEHGEDQEGILELKPGEVYTATLTFLSPRNWTRRLHSLQTGLSLPPVEIVTTFTDGHGLRWTRKGRNKPERDELVRTRIVLVPLIAEYFRLPQASWKVRRRNRALRHRLQMALQRRLDQRNGYVPLPRSRKAPLRADARTSAETDRA
jgi:hypothetical protein